MRRAGVRLHPAVGSFTRRGGSRARVAWRRRAASSRFRPYHGNDLSGPVAIPVSTQAPDVLTVPLLGAQTGPTGSGPTGTTPFASSLA